MAGADLNLVVCWAVFNLYSSTDILEALQTNINPVSAPRNLHSKYKVTQSWKEKTKKSWRGGLGAKTSTCRAILTSVL